MDAGGPLCEFFHLMLSEIARNNTLFCGKAIARIPKHNMVELSKQTYKYIGSILAASIIHGGPAPRFFSDAVANYIVYGIERAKVSVEDVPCPLMKEKLQKVCIMYVCVKWLPPTSRGLASILAMNLYHYNEKK